MSLHRLAELSGVDKSNISRLETGQAPRSSLASLTRLAEALGADPVLFYKAAGQPADTSLPSFRPYLRAKYSHLPEDKLDELSAFFETIEAEQAAKRERSSRAKPSR